jgi:hypothetical protein
MHERRLLDSFAKAVNGPCGCLTLPYIGPELLDALFGLPNTWSWFQKETHAVDALASLRNDHSEVAEPNANHLQQATAMVRSNAIASKALNRGINRDSSIKKCSFHDANDIPTAVR